MKKIAITFSIILVLISNLSVKAQTSPHVKAEGENISVSYGQPSKSGRVVFGELVPYGEIWPTCDNEASEITIKQDGMLGDKQLHKGTYRLFAIPQKDKWVIILTSKVGLGGPNDYDENVFEVPAKHLEKVVEKMTFTIEKGVINLKWDQTGISIPYVLAKN